MTNNAIRRTEKNNRVTHSLNTENKKAGKDGNIKHVQLAQTRDPV